MSIPYLCHQIWVGPSPIPPREAEWSKRWASLNPTWIHKVHGNEIYERFGNDPYVKYMVAKGEKIAFITDRLRVLLLQDEGGVYVDMDAEPLRPLSAEPFWAYPHVDFVGALRSPHRTDVALNRAIPIVDNTFMASRPQGRMIAHIASLWTPSQVTGPLHAINGHRTGIAILEHADHTMVLLNHRYALSMQQFPESFFLHDSHNLGSWVPKI